MARKVSHNPAKSKSDLDEDTQWQIADDEVRNNLPLGVSLLRTLRGHTGWIGRIAWSPDGRLIASPSEDKTIRLWSVETGECLHILQGHTDRVNCINFDPAGAILASGGDSVKLWEVSSGLLIRTLKESHGIIQSVAFDPSGRQVAGGIDRGGDGLKLWDVSSGRLLRSFENADSSGVYSVAFDLTGRQIVSAGWDDYALKLWDVQSGRLLQTMKGHQREILSIAFEPSGKQIASASGDGTIKLWEATSGKLIRTLEGHTNGVTCVAYLQNTGLLASKGWEDDDTVRLWRSDTGALLGVISEPASGWFPSLAFHPSRHLLATTGSDPSLTKEDLGREDIRDRVIHLYELKLDLLLGQPTQHSVSYTSAKVVLVGDSGVGKTGRDWAGV
jgi:WD40 repeat protein